MVPDKFDMVDMGGIDLIESQGVVVEGLYQRLVESIALCRYQCLYNWKFNGILIPPSYVEMEVHEDGVWINEGVNVDENDVVHIQSVEPEPIQPEIIPLSVAENGEYYAPVGVDGYNPVNVSVIGTVVEFRTTRPLDSEGADGDICALYIEELTYKFFRLIVTGVRSSGMQMSEIRFLLNGSHAEIPDGTLITSTAAPYSSSESVDKLLDGNVNTKYYTTTVPVTITIEFPEQVNFTGWEWYTANDASGRDPVSFTAEVSSNGNDWTTISSESNYNTPTARNTLAYQTETSNGVYEVLIKENGTWVNIMGYLPG